MTKEEAVKRFRKHWQWLAETSSPKKWEYPDLVDGESIKNSCYLCQYLADNCIPCEVNNCLVFWDRTSCMGAGSLYYRWWRSDSEEERKILAREISELPERE